MYIFVVYVNNERIYVRTANMGTVVCKYSHVYSEISVVLDYLDS